ncbi:hypothetical protein [Nitrosomonas sp. PY1]|uniref:hypothetical protein n=1 Tax=Nitrosomonas sp. PY1 TaxID=1803906 RepID=UPI001FC8A883|nr:hypothetical protein [Nitrosomonas sp. PY1]
MYSIPGSNGKPCLKSIEAPDPETSNIRAIAYFNGTVLVISYGLIFENKGYVLGNPIPFNDNSFFPNAFNLIFDYSPTTQTFKLVNATELSNGYVMLQGESDTRTFTSIQAQPFIQTEGIQYLISE